MSEHTLFTLVCVCLSLISRLSITLVVICTRFNESTIGMQRHQTHLGCLPHSYCTLSLHITSQAPHTLTGNTRWGWGGCRRRGEDGSDWVAGLGGWVARWGGRETARAWGLWEIRRESYLSVPLQRCHSFSTSDIHIRIFRLYFLTSLCISWVSVPLGINCRRTEFASIFRLIHKQLAMLNVTWTNAKRLKCYRKKKKPLLLQEFKCTDLRRTWRTRI